MKKKFLSFLLALVLVAGILPTASFAASPTEGGALGEVDIYNGGDEFGYLSINGRVQKFLYTYYNFNSKDGTVKEIPAYCVNPNLYGVPQTVPKGHSIKYLASEKSSDPKVMGIVANGYPTRSLYELQLDNKEQAYYATKIALWCYILPGWNISNLKLNPSLSGTEKAIGEKILRSAKEIYSRGTAWDKVYEPNFSVVADRAVAYPVTVDGKQYKQQIFTVTSETWICNYAVQVGFTDPSEVPSGTRIVDMSNRDITTITTADINGKYGGQFKVLYPADSVAGKTGTVQLSLNAQVYNYGIYYAICQEKDRYGNLQNYMCDTDPTTDVTTNGLSSYNADEIIIEEQTALKIIKLETGTNLPLFGTQFEVVDPNGATVGVFSTNYDGQILLPLDLIGNYTVYERQPAPDHKFGAVTVQNVDVVYGKTATLTFYNDPYGTLRVQKLSDTGEYLRGVTIQVKNIQTGAVYSAKTGVAGIATFEVAPGSYEVKETAGISGWIADTDTVQTVQVNSGETATATFTNKELPGLRILKYERNSMEAMEKVTFEVFRDNVSIGTFETDAMGEILIPNAQPGSYRVREVRTGDDSHIIVTTEQNIELKAGDGIRELTFFNDVKPGIHLVKVDAADPSKGIPNAVFEIKSVDGTFQAKEFTTDRNGEIDLSKLDPKAYVITEKSCPGYVIDNAQRIVELRANTNAEFVFTNKKLPSLTLTKYSTLGSRLAGVSFRLAKIKDGTHYIDRTTDLNGEIIWSGMEPGVYSLVETATVNDHILNKKEYHVELFPGKDSSIVLQNDKKPNLTIHKNDADTGEPVEGAVFTVRAADGSTVNEVRTDRNGVATLKNLWPIAYEVTEKSVPQPYLLDAPKQLITLYPNRDSDIYFENHRAPTIEILKTDSITNEPIANVRFQIWYASNKTSSGEMRSLGVFTTDTNGRILLTEPKFQIEDGWYRVTELEPQKGYAIKDSDTQEFFVQGGKAHTFRFQNTPLSALAVWKYDSVTHEAVEGAIFQVKYLAGNSGTGGTVIGTYKTGANGSFTVTGLQAGTYVVEELASDKDHVIDSAPQTVYISGKDQDVVQLWFGNAPKGDLLVKKVDSATGAPLSDVEFLVTLADGSVVGNANGKFVTDRSGSFIVSGLNPGASLVVREVKAKDGYILDNTPQTAEIKAGKTVTLEFRNQSKGGLLIRKIDGLTKRPLPGVEFKVTTSEGTNLGKENGIFRTDSNGTITITDVAPGTTLVAREIKTLPSHVLDTTAQTAIIRSNEVAELEFRNYPKSSVLVKKVDALTGKPLADAEFTVTTEDGKAVGSEKGKFVTDSMGTFVVANIAPETVLVIRESKAPKGYLQDDTPQTAKIISGQVVIREFRDQPKGAVLVKKVDAVTKAPLSDVEFMVTASNGQVVGDGNGKFLTDSNGSFLISGVEPGTGLVIKEVRAKDGYVLDNTPQTVEVQAGKTVTVEFRNQPKGALVIVKRDADTKKPLQGAEFRVTTSNGTYVDAQGGKVSSKGLYTTDKEGQIIITGLEPCTVVVSETKAPRGYVLDETPQTVAINTNDTQTLYFYDKPIPTGDLKILKLDEETRQPIQGVEFSVSRINGERLGLYRTNSKGIIYLEELEPGWYTVQETKAAKDYRLDAEPKDIEVKNGKTATLEVTNRLTGSALIHKVDSVTGKGIYGVTFLVSDAKGNPVGQYTSDDQGYVYINGELEDGKYTIREIQTASGYILDTIPRTIYIEYGGCPTIRWTNTPATGQIQIYKFAAEANSITGIPAGTPLQGAVYEISEARSGKVVEYITTDARGVAASKPLALNRYKIREVTAPAFWQLDGTVFDAELEYSGQIIKLSAYDKAAKLGVTITKRSNAEVLAGSQMRYDITVANTSNVPLEGFFWHDRIPTDAARATVLTTGTYSARLNYRILYKTNYSDYRELASNLLTSNNYSFALNAIPMQMGEVLTDVYFDFDKVPVGFQSVVGPTLSVNVLASAANGYQLVNRADVGGKYQSTWQTAQAGWLTVIRKLAVTPPPTLPKTGY